MSGGHHLTEEDDSRQYIRRTPTAFGQLWKIDLAPGNAMQK